MKNESCPVRQEKRKRETDKKKIEKTVDKLPRTMLLYGQGVGRVKNNPLSFIWNSKNPQSVILVFFCFEALTFYADLVICLRCQGYGNVTTKRKIHYAKKPRNIRMRLGL